MTFIYALWGAGVAIGLYVLGFGIEVLNCVACICSLGRNHNSDALPIWNTTTFGHIFWFCVIGGAIIGLVYDLAKAKENWDREKRQEAYEKSQIDAEKAVKKQQEAEELAKRRKQRALDRYKQCMEKISKAYDLCLQNKKDNEVLALSSYVAGTQISNIMDELLWVSELQGEIDSFAKELMEEEGASA